MDQTHQSHASTSSRPALTSAETYAKTSADSEPIAKKLKVASPLQGSHESTQNSNGHGWNANLREKLNKARSIIMGVASSAKIVMDRNADEDLRAHLELLLTRTADAFTAVDSLLEKNGNVVGLPKNCSPAGVSSGKTMSDASTDMELTPGFWDSQASRTTAAIRRKRIKKAPAAQHPPETEADTAMETDAEEWSKVVGRRSKQASKMTAAAPPLITGLRQRPSVFSKKPPAILIQNAAGKSYQDTILAVRNCGLTREEIGTSVMMRQTRDGCLLLELPKGSSSTKAAKIIASAMSSKLGDTVGKVVQLGVQVEVEVLDIDAAATASEVLEALRNAIPGQDDPTGKIDRDVVSDVRIWSTRSGQQIATAKMPRSIAASITRVPIGWTMCRVRPRTLPPERCFRCQAFGHNARSCTAEDRTGACWKCGVVGHAMKDCKEADDRCIACEIIGLQRVLHKPGSGACAARRQSAGTGLR